MGIRRRQLRAAAAALAVAAFALAGCGDDAASAGGASAPATVPDGLAETGTTATDPAAVRFDACARGAAHPTTTNLRPVARVDASNDRYPGGPDIPHGKVRTERAGSLVLADGRLAAGSAADVLLGGTQPVAVAPPGTVADVTQVVLDSPGAGRRVAFVEVRLRPTTPVAWAVDDRLSFGTDGGDGGFASGAAPWFDADAGFDVALKAYIEAAFPGGDSRSGNVCVIERTRDGSIDAVLFSAGYGDGSYPSLVGTDARGRIASVVSFGHVLPWRYAGLPGAPPPRSALE